MSAYKQIVNSFLIVSFTFCCQTLKANLSSFSRNDPYPVFTSLDPHEFLLTKRKLLIRDPEYAACKNDIVSLSISPFGQNANRGRNLSGFREFAGFRIELGDLPAGCFTQGGRWDMIALLFGPLPNGESLPPTLQEAFDTLFPGMVPGTIENPDLIDPNQRLGFFTVPLKYRKRGIRFELEANFLGGFGLRFQAGLASISQTITGFVDLTCNAPIECPLVDPPVNEEFRNNVVRTLTSQLKNIATEIGLDICDFCETSVDEIRFNIFWRNMYELNADRPDWAHFVYLPFIEFGGSVSPGKRTKPFKKFSVPFGNNGHNSIGITAGMNFDFIETMEIGAEAGITHFFAESFSNFFVPNSRCQSNIYPFKTDVRISPGHNWHFGAKIAAYHFLERLSFWFQFVIVEHKADKVTLCCPDPAFAPEQLELLSPFKVKIANMAFTYDITPNMGLGVFWQAPISQRNAYRSSTVMGTFYTTF